MHTQWCTDVTVTNSDMQIRKKENVSKKYWLTKYVIKLLINEWQNPHNLQHIVTYVVLVSKQKLKQYCFWSS